MNCFSRSTLGIAIGCLNILAYVICVIGAIVFLVKLNGGEKRNQEEIKAAAYLTTMLIVIIVVCFIMLFIPALLIMGIVKRRHQHMLPWLIFSGIGFVCNCLRVILLLIASINAGGPFKQILFILITSVAGIGLSAVILRCIFTLYRDIRRENIEKRGYVMDSNPVPYRI